MSSTTTVTASAEARKPSIGSFGWLAARKWEHDLAAMKQGQARRRTSTTIRASSGTSSTHVSEPSKLLSLPPELRNEIYSALFPSGGVERIRPDYRFPGFLLANKQIHAEAMGLYYSNTIFRCLDEESAVSWLGNLPRKWLELVPEVRYDTRWMIFVTPFIPVPGAEGWLFQSLVRKLSERGFDVNQLGARVGSDGEPVGDGKLKVSFYGEGVVKWTDKPGLIEVVRGH